MSLTKETIAFAVYEQLGDVSQVEAGQYVETVLETIKATLASGEDVLISGFGKFSVRTKDARRGRNPATGEDVMLDARKVVTFRASTVLRSKLNGGASD